MKAHSSRYRSSRRRLLSTALSTGTLLSLAAGARPGLAAPQPTRVATPDASPPPGSDGATVAPLTGELLATFESFIAGALDQLEVLGAAIAVVQDANIVYLGGFGVRSPDSSDPVTPDTVMMVDSLTKPITSLMAATLVDDGVLGWAMPVSDLLPGFAVADPELTAQLTVADLFCACSGIPRNDPDILFNVNQLSPEALIAAAATLRPNAAMGERFQYSNHLYAIGGYAAASAMAPESAAGGLRDAYVQAMWRQVLDPIEMTHSTFDMSEATRSDNHAVPAAPLLTGEIEELPLAGEEAFADAVEPAGGLWSTAADMVRFLQVQLAGGVTPNGVRVVSETSLAETWRSRVTIPPDPNLPPSLANVRSGYGLGWFTGDYAGTSIVSHDGGVAGFISQMALLPELGLGIVVLTNGGAYARPFASAVPVRLFELLLTQPPEIESLLQQQVAMLAAQADALRATLGPIDTAAVTPFLGRYVNPNLGEVTISLEGDRLTFDAGEVQSALRPRLNEAGQAIDYLFEAPPLSVLPVSLVLEMNAGRPQASLSIAGPEGVTYVFTPA